MERVAFRAQTIVADVILAAIAFVLAFIPSRHPRRRLSMSSPACRR